ncbi:LOW QUALITY PROTEIN: tumor necrosis factor receptor superfamily member 25 [Cariama cristata]
MGEEGMTTLVVLILAVLWLAAGELQPPGCQDCAGQRVLVRLPARPRRYATKPPCPTGMNWIESAHRCCTRCPAGTFLHTPCSSHGNDSVCTTCPAGTFRAQPNTFHECEACYECDRQGELAACRAMPAMLCCAAWCRAVSCHAAPCHAAHHLSSAAFQSVLSNCSATSNVACGCKPGHFRYCLDERCSDFSCQQCQSCTGRLIQRPCSEVQDTLCGSCKPDFYAEGGECRPCHMSAPETCGKECQRACGSSGGQGSGLEYVLLALTGPLFLGALAIYHKRKQLRHNTSADGPLLTARAATPAAGAVATPWCQASVRWWDNPCWTQPCSSQVTECATSTARQSSKHWASLREQPGSVVQPGSEVEPSASPEPRGTLLQGSQLYAVINAVPVRRWKEFMRVLELREAEIELVELEVAHIRDQQYEMLKRWCQQTSATLDRVFTALEHMELAGCAEALRRSLLAGP